MPRLLQEQRMPSAVQPQTVSPTEVRDSTSPKPEHGMFLSGVCLEASKINISDPDDIHTSFWCWIRDRGSGSTMKLLSTDKLLASTTVKQDSVVEMAHTESLKTEEE